MFTKLNYQPLSFHARPNKLHRANQQVISYKRAKGFFHSPIGW